MKIEIKKTLLTVLCLVLGHSLLAQNDTIPPYKDIAIINNEIVRTSNLIDKVNTKVTDTIVEVLQKNSNLLFDSANNFLRRQVDNHIEDGSLRSLEIKLSEIKLFKDDNEKFLSEVDKRAEEFGENFNAIVFQEQKWKNTKDYLASSNMDELSVLVNNVDQIIEKILTAKKELLKEYNQILEIQSRHNQLDLSLEQASNSITAVRERYKRKFFNLDSPPIWKVKVNFGQLIRDFKSDFRSLAVVSIIYFKNEKQLPGRLLFIFIVLLVIFLYMRRFYHKIIPKIEGDKNISFTQDDYNRLKIFKRPFSLAVLVSFLIIYYVESMPIEITELFIILMIVPMLMILYERVNRKYFKYVLYIFSLFIIQNVSEILLYNSSISRIINLVIGILFIILLIYLNKNILARITKEDFSFKKIVQVFSTLILTLLIVATLSNIVGNVFLSDSLFFSTMTSLYSGFIYVICYLSISQMVVLLSYNFAERGSKVFVKSREKLSAQIQNTIFLILFLFWFDLVLRIFRIRSVVYGVFDQLFAYNFDLGDINIVPANLIILVFVIWLTFKLSNFIRELLENDILAHMKLPRGVPGTISMLSRYSIMFIGFVIAIMAAGIKLDKLAIIIGGLGVGIGFGLQNIINNFISGIILAFERPIKVGDIIQMEDLYGTVREIGIRSSTVRSLDGAEVIVPNGNLISNELINWTLSDKFRRLDLRIGVAYGTDPDKVLEILKKVMTNHDRIMESPPPQALFIGFGDSSLDFRLLFWTNDFENRLQVESDINVRINNELKKAGIEIPFPQRDLHLRSVSKEIDLMPKPKPPARKK